MTWYSPLNQAQRQYILAHLDFGKTKSHIKGHIGSYFTDHNVTLLNFSLVTVSLPLNTEVKTHIACFDP